MSAEIEHDSSQEIYLKAAQVRQRYGNCSDMWITRRQRDEGFPEPDYFGGLRFWKLSDLERWERERKAAPKARRVRNMKTARAAQ
jgi:hypothetical protein